MFVRIKMFYVRVVSGSVVFGAGTSEIEERLKSFELKTGNFVKLWSSRNDTFLHRCGHDTGLGREARLI